MNGARVSSSVVFAVLAAASLAAAAEPFQPSLSEAFSALERQASPAVRAQKALSSAPAVDALSSDPRLQTLGSPTRYASEADAAAAMQAAEKKLAGYLIVDAATTFDTNPDYPYTYTVKFIAAPRLQTLSSPTRYATQGEADAAMAAAEKTLAGAGYIIVDAADPFNTNPTYPYEYVVDFIAAPPSA
jgi:hypothetical protein